VSERLVIRLGCNAESSIHWLQFNDKAQEVIASGTLNNAAELTQLSQVAISANVQILVPGGDISYFEVPVPKSNRRQAIAAIPFMLEDDLAADIDTLHFVYSASKADMQGVYVCSKDKLNDWLSWLSEADIESAQLMPDYLALPTADADHVSLLRLDDQLLMRVNEFHGHTFTENWLSVVLTQLAQNDEGMTVEHFDVDEALHIEPHNWLAQPLVPAMQQLAANIVKFPMNMLIGEFEQNKQQHNHWKIWRGMAVAATLLVVLFFTHQVIHVNQLEQQQLALKKQSESIYRQINPNVRRILKLKVRMKNEIAQLSGGGQGNKLLSMLDAMQQAFIAVPTLKPASIKYDHRRQELRLQAEADSYQQFEQFKKVLDAQYSVTMGAMNNNGNKVNGSLAVKVSS
jgi:general secretion pathway protein L